MRAAPLTTVRGGIDRQRLKGGARADVLYDLVNGYTTEVGTIKCRPGTRRIAELDENTKGLVHFDGTLNTFAPVSVSVPAGFTLHILEHPDAEPGYELAITTIHFAEPMMGALYVVAEFEDGGVYHYWLQDGAEWEADTEYAVGDMAVPTVLTGYVYRALRRSAPYPSWAPSVPRYDGLGYEAQSIIEPTEYNGFGYECIETQGTTPRSGPTEPEWPEETGAIIIESAEAGTIVVQTTPTTEPPEPSSISLSGVTGDRYDRFFETSQ